MADDSPPIVAPADEVTRSLQPLDEWARVRLESVRDFLLLEGGRMMSMPDVSDPQREIISANVGLLDIRIAELVEYIGSLEPSYQRLRLFKMCRGRYRRRFSDRDKGRERQGD